MSGTSTQSLNWPPFPKAILSVSRQEHYQQPLRLNILSRKDPLLQTENVDPSSERFLHPKYWDVHSPNDLSETGPLPPDLKGHLFIIGPAASLGSHPLPGTDQIYLPTEDGWQHMYSGDGMIYRLDFHTSLQYQSHADPPYPDKLYTSTHQPGWANLATRLIKTPDYYADWALQHQTRYKSWPDYAQSRFRDAALTRLSISLGARNYLNTAWLPLKPQDSDRERLLVTWDAGRPYEVDPCSLGLIAPVGHLQDWKPVFEMARLSRWCKRLPVLSRFVTRLSQVFPMMLTTAHPVYDKNEDAVYLVNATKSIKNTLQIPRLAPYLIKGMLKILDLHPEPEQTHPKPSCLRHLLGAVMGLVLWIIHVIISALSVLGPGGQDRLFLYRWQGQQTAIDDSERWEIVNERGWSIPILQSTHQMALTKDYILISDSSFKLVLADVLPSLLNYQDFAQNLRRLANGVIKIKNLIGKLFQPHLMSTAAQPKNSPEQGESLREQLQFLCSFLNYPQTPYTDIYVIPRAALDSAHQTHNDYSKARSRPPKIKAKHFQLTPETAHFLTSYDNPEHKVVLHVGHIQGLDPAEFVNKIDQAIDHYSPTNGSNQPSPQTLNHILQARSGVLANSMAPNHLGVWTLDIKTGEQQKVTLTEDDKFQLLAFFTLNENTAKQVTDVYWNCGGAWPYHHTTNHLDLYQHQIASDILDQQINRIAKEGRPATLLRVQQTVNFNPQNTPDLVRLSTVDHYAFPPGYYVSSPQFLPQENDPNSPTAGYIVCVVVATDSFETDQKEHPKLSELWIFDAAHLSQGPLYRLYHPQLNMGPTLHTAWLSKLETPPRNDYDVRDDYQVVLDQVEPKAFQQRVLELFEHDVFPQVIRDHAEILVKQTFKLRIFDTSVAALALQTIHHQVQRYAAICRYAHPVVVREDPNALCIDLQYQVNQRVSHPQWAEILETGIERYRHSQLHRPNRTDNPEAQFIDQAAESIAGLLRAVRGVKDAVLHLGPLMIIKSTTPGRTTQTYAKLLSEQLQNKVEQTPELLESAQAMVNFLYNRAELPDAIAEPTFQHRSQSSISPPRNKTLR